jgi:DNA-binding MarR family transcriptional regulator
MNKTVTLVNEWGDFEKKHPEGNIDDFCRYYLAHKKEIIPEPTTHQALVPTNVDSMLMRLMGRIMLVHSIYADVALEGTGINHVEEFSMLNAVYQLKNPKKSEVIYACLHEISTGTDILNRLRKLNYLTEQDDKEDRRSKRLTITAKGEKVVLNCRNRMASLAKMMLNGMEVEDKKLCIHFLKNIEIKFAPILQQHKGKPFDEIYNSIVKQDSIVKQKKK